MDYQVHQPTLVTPELVDQLNQIASKNQSVLIYGPKDIGKEWVAELLHDLSSRNESPFLIINCLTSTGHAPFVELAHPVRREFFELLKYAGSGYLEAAKGGTVWVNNMMDLPVTEQGLIAASISRNLNARIISGINKQFLTRMQSEPDLPGIQDRITITVPPLRNNKRTIQFFANYFLAKANVEWNRDVQGFDEEAAESISNYAWPGNLTELRDVVRESVLIAKDGMPIPSQILPMAVKNYQSQDPLFLKKAVLKAEYDLICKTLYETKNNKRKAAEILKISRKTLYSKMRIFQDVTKQGSAA